MKWNKIQKVLEEIKSEKKEHSSISSCVDNYDYSAMSNSIFNMKVKDLVKEVEQ